MESLAPSNCEVLTVIKFVNEKGVTGSEIHHRLSDVFGALPSLKRGLGSRHISQWKRPAERRC